MTSANLRGSNLPEYDEVHVISDLHMGDPQGFQILEETTRLANFIRWVAAQRAGERVALSPAGKSILSGHRDGAVRMWNAPDAWIGRVCAKLVRNLSHVEWNEYVGSIPYVKQCLELSVPRTE